MREVSSQTVLLVGDGLAHRGMALAPLLEGLGFTEEDLADPKGRLDWEDWVVLLERVEEAVGGPEELSRLFVPNAGARTGHTFVRFANTFLTVEDLYRLLARYGLMRQLMVVRGRFEQGDDYTPRLTVTIDPTRVGSAPTLRFMAGMLAALPGLQGLPHAKVRAHIEPHRGVYDLTLPRSRSLISWVRRIVGVVGGARATLAELEAQTEEISLKNAELEVRVAGLAEAEASLREQGEWLDLALEEGKIGVWSWDKKSGRPRYSPSLLRLSELPPDASTDALLARIHPDDREATRQAFQFALMPGRSEVEYRVQRADGGLAWLRATGQATRNAAGEVERVVGTVADITEQKQLETRIRFADRLIAAGTLAAGVAHEINNPLAYVLANVEHLRERTKMLGAEAPFFEQLLLETSDGVHRIRDIVRDLRTFARPEEEHVSLVDLREVAEVALRIVSHEVRHRARVETRYADGPVCVMANESRIGQVITNLLINAAQAMPARPAHENSIEIRVERRGDASVLEVEDNGAGIAPQILPRLFDPFFTTKAPGEGTGLGLPVCQGIVQALNGRIEVESELGRGSTFRVWLPAAAAVARVDAAPEEPPSRPSRRVLVIDDEPLVRRVLRRTLEAAGCEVVEAAGGRAGLDLALRGEPFDAVVCDLMMPDLTGMDLFEELALQRPDLARRTVFLTGGAVTDRARAFVAASTNPILQKPFRADELLEAVGRA